MTKRHSVPVAALSTAIAFTALTMPPPAAQACSLETGYIGALCIMASDYCPLGTVPADGTIYKIKGHEALNAVLGCHYGGDCQSTFAVPDLRGRSIVGIGQGTGLVPMFLGERRGVETIAQTLETLPPHTHGLPTTGEDFHLHGTMTVIPGTPSETKGTKTPKASTTYALTGITGRAKYGPYATGDAGTTPATVNGETAQDTFHLDTATTSTGAGTPMQNLPPQMALTICIVTEEGIFPPTP